MFFALAGICLSALIYVLTQARSTEKRLTALETKISLFWKVIEEGTVQLLHRDDTPKTDMLLDKAADNTLTKEEARELIDELKQIEEDKSRPRGEAAAALMMRAVLVARFDDK